MSVKSKGAAGGGGAALAMPAIVILVGLAAFGLGRLSALSGPLAGSGQGRAVPHAYVGSKSGSVYYLPSCKGAQAIAEANKVWFATAEDAKAAGYAPAANCPGV